MRISNNLGSFNRFVTVVSWRLIIFISFFLSSNARIDRIDRRIDSLTEEILRAFFLPNESWEFVARGKSNRLQMKKRYVKILHTEKRKKKKNFYQRHAKLFHPILDKTYVPLKCTKKFSLSRSFFLCYSLVSPYILSLSTSRTHHSV